MDNDYQCIISEKKQEMENMGLVIVQESMINEGFHPGVVQSSIMKAMDISIKIDSFKKPNIKVSKNIFDNRRSSANTGAGQFL